MQIQNKNNIYDNYIYYIYILIMHLSKETLKRKTLTRCRQLTNSRNTTTQQILNTERQNHEDRRQQTS